METRDKKTDRRSMRSKQAILNAFRELAIEGDVNLITVTDIVKKANIGRTTFYAHFEDMFDLRRYLFARLLQQIEEAIEATLTEEEESDKKWPYQEILPALALFKIAEEKHVPFKMNALHPEHGLRMLVPPLMQRFEKQVDVMGIDDSQRTISRRMIASYLCNGLITLLIDWVVADMPESPEAMAHKFQILATPTLELLINQ